MFENNNSNVWGASGIERERHLHISKSLYYFPWNWLQWYILSTRIPVDFSSCHTLRLCQTYQTKISVSLRAFPSLKCPDWNNIVPNHTSPGFQATPWSQQTCHQKPILTSPPNGSRCCLGTKSKTCWHISTVMIKSLHSIQQQNHQTSWILCMPLTECDMYHPMHPIPLWKLCR